MSLNWSNLRPWSGSQHVAFEELCCQLAGSEPPCAGARFYRKGAPDAGVECFWRLPNGDEHGWQAKFFLSAPTAGQWSQLDKSVEVALEKHPRLTRYTICLPIDRSDARLRGKKSFLQKWNERVTKWERLAIKRNLPVDFAYWGEHDIFLRLSKPEHCGRLWFWFGDQQFSLDWFRARLNEAIAIASDRYTPELHVELPISRYFEGLARTRRFFDEPIDIYKKLKQTHSWLTWRIKQVQELKTTGEKMENAVSTLFEKLQATLLDSSAYPWQDPSVTVDWSSLGDHVSLSISGCEEIRTRLQALKEQKEAEEKAKGTETGRTSEVYREELYYLFELARLLEELAAFCGGERAALVNNPAFLIVGEAGQGKTHLLCDVATQGLAAGRPGILLHGSHFENGEPWTQIVKELGLDCNRDEFLGALEAAAQASKCRILILIDALNEGDGSSLWKKYLAGMLVTLKQHPWLGIALTVRSSYEDLVVEEGSSTAKQLVRVEHVGFREHEYEASQRFFGHYGIQPTLPLLHPEFSNPLFLKLLCQGIRNQGMTQVPVGLHGITALLGFFIDAANERLSKPDRLDYDPQERYVRRAIEKLAAAMASQGTRFLQRAEVRGLIDPIRPSDGYQTSLFRHLIAEGVLAEYRWRKDGGHEEIVCFTYERFGDHLIANHLLDKHLDTQNPKRSFAKRRKLGQLCKDEPSCWRNRGLIEALSIQLPERIGKELAELAPHAAIYSALREAFVESIVWRSPQAFSDASLKYINAEVLRYRKSFEDFFDAHLTVAPIPGHFLSADRLHAHLLKFGIADRDAWWSTMLHRQWGSQGAVERLVEWAWAENDKTAVPNEAVRLTGIAMAWFLTSANRYLRDRATRGMVRLFERRISCLREVLKVFAAIDDPYVKERLLAVAYGCALRSTEPEAVGKLAQDVYDWIFRDKKPPPSILLRDYARGVVETALHRGQSLNIDEARVRPPYNSRWPALKVPKSKDVEAWKWKDGVTGKEYARTKIYNDVMGGFLDDFSRNVIGHLDEWSQERIGRPHKPTRKELHDRFVQSLTPRQKQAWDTLQSAGHKLAMETLQRLLKQTQFRKSMLTPEKKAATCKQAEQNFLKTLRTDPKKAAMFQKVVKPYLAEPRKYHEEDRFDGKLARRWMMGKIVELGWTVQRFGDFDSNVNRYASVDRRGYGSGRIGEKYQWIALYELLARLSDNFKFYQDRWPRRIGLYEGPWQLRFRRDLDPSNLLRTTPKESWMQDHSTTWWSPVSYSSWDQPSDHRAWLNKHQDLPLAESLIEVENTEDGSRWFALEASCGWYQPPPPGEERFELPRRHIWYQIRSYLVREKDAAKVFDWAKKQNFMGRWMPESHDTCADLFLGEYFWAPAFRSLDVPYYGRDGWTQGSQDRIPVPVLVTTDGYLQERGGGDFSADETIQITLPCKLIAGGMNLRWNGVEGHFFDSRGMLAAFDPSVRATGPGALLMRRESFLEFLKAEGYQVLWTILGEKQVIGRGNEYWGRLEINGAFTLKNGALGGARCAKFVPPPVTARSFKGKRQLKKS